MGLKSLIVQLLVAAPLGLAHPHGSGEKEKLHWALPFEKRGLSHCKANLEHPDFVKRTIERRFAEIETLKVDRGIYDQPTVIKRQQNSNAAKVLAINHQVNIKPTDDTDIAALLADSGACVLTPEVTEGPLYVRGEQVRRNITETEKGVPMRIHIQVVDVKTCEPVPQVHIDLWSCNTTGVYGGVTGYPGNGVNANDPRLLNATVLRGVQPTDEEGIAVFDSLVPGHYAGRATHFHAMVHHGATVLPNKTITGGRVSHVGQVYFDMSLLEAVEKTAPYNTNKQNWVQNRADALFTQGAGNNHDPIVRYAKLSENISDGIFAWIRFAVDVSATRRYNPAAWIDESGGHRAGGGQGFGAGGGGGRVMPAPGGGGRP